MPATRNASRRVLLEPPRGGQEPIDVRPPAAMPARRVLAIAGSLRKGSFNRLLLETAAERARMAGLDIGIFEGLAEIPLFDEDLERASGGAPEPVRRLRHAVASADGLLIATPEYNQSMPGVLKNAIDWMSRRAPDRILSGKPVAVMGATTGPWGTRLAQASVRQVLAACESLVLPGPAVYVRDAASRFDEAGRLTEAGTIQAVDALLVAFHGWIERLSPVAASTTAAA